MPACFQLGECQGSLYVGNERVADVQACLEMCQDSQDCQYFSFYQDEAGGDCVQFANCVDFSIDTCTDCFSGHQTCPGKHLNDRSSSNNSK